MNISQNTAIGAVVSAEVFLYYLIAEVRLLL